VTVDRGRAEQHPPRQPSPARARAKRIGTSARLRRTAPARTMLRAHGRRAPSVWPGGTAGALIVGFGAKGVPMSRWMLIVSIAAACGGAGRPPARASRSQGADDDPRRVPDGYVRMEARDVVSVPQGGAVLLVDPSGAVVLPIGIGGTEAVSIALRLNSQPSPRPLTHDLLDTVIRQLGGELVKVQVDRMEDGIFIGSIFLRTASGIRRIDARPSDAIALAIGNRVPIYVARAVLDSSGVKPSQLEDTQA
jgi:uncharacterized protein